jgi:hypothetical protein
MTRAMPPDIRSQFTIPSGFRSPEREAEVYATQHPGQPVPTDSAHSHGIAVDVGKNPAVINWISQHGKDFGVQFPLASTPGEENHLEPIAGRSAAGTASAEGRVEWRNVSDMLIRRAKPNLDEIKPSMMGKAWGALKAVGRTMIPGEEPQ